MSCFIIINYLKISIMPAKSEKQRRLMGAALACKRDEDKCISKEVRKVAQGMSEGQLEDFASKPIKKKRSK